MNVLFLDVDGVLNTRYTKDRVYGTTKLIGIEDRYVANLKKIIDVTDAKIVLTSSWKRWIKIDDQQGQYLKDKLAVFGLEVYDVTEDRGDNRGYGILQYVGHNNVTRWVVLDDEEFDDYRAFGIMRHLVKTTWYMEDGGLGESDAEEAIKILKGENNG